MGQVRPAEEVASLHRSVHPKYQTWRKVSMSTLDVLFSNLMIFGAVFFFLRIKKFITWDWGLVLAPVVVALLIKGYLIFVNRALQ